MSLRNEGQKTGDIKLKDLSKSFPSLSDNEELFAVNNVTLDFKPGVLTTLLGPSGCGKTTTLRMLAGFEFPTSGKIYIDGEDVTNMPPNKRDIGMIFQSYALFPHLTVFENVAYGLKIKKLPKSEIIERVNKVLALLHLEKFKKRKPSYISGGQQQRVAIARSIVTEPKILLFDEPLSNLDAKLREYMRDELRNIQSRLGITSVYVTHDQEEAMAISDNIVIMNNGQIQQVGPPNQIYSEPENKFIADFIGKANFIETRVIDIGSENIKLNVEGISIYTKRQNNDNVKVAKLSIV